jgi:hypothetical protein
MRKVERHLIDTPFSSECRNRYIAYSSESVNRSFDCDERSAPCFPEVLRYQRWYQRLG